MPTPTKARRKAARKPRKTVEKQAQPTPEPELVAVSPTLTPSPGVWRYLVEPWRCDTCRSALPAAGLVYLHQQLGPLCSECALSDSTAGHEARAMQLARFTSGGSGRG